jgi:hypothetical protein
MHAQKKIPLDHKERNKREISPEVVCTPRPLREAVFRTKEKYVYKRFVHFKKNPRISKVAHHFVLKINK